jgi:hypothetical protein
MPRPLATPFRALAIAVLVALPFAFLGACGSETGVTPGCTPNVDANGVNTSVESGCTGFAICAENPSNPAVCCREADVKGSKGPAYTGEKLAFCLLSYGVGAPTSAASSSSSSASSSTGTGG